MTGVDVRGFPSNLLRAAEQEGRQDWLATVPGTVPRLARRWSLTVEAAFQPGGQTAWVAPARDARGNELVLKVAWRHPEADHEADGLRVWAGAGAVRLYAADESDDTIVLLLERCTPGAALAGQPEPFQDLIVTELLKRLWVEPPTGHRFRPLQQMCERWADAFENRHAAGEPGLDAGICREGITLFRNLPTTGERHVLLCTDLHAENVLTARREPWLVIDPKPYIGDPTYDALQHMLNCPRRLHADPNALVARIADLLGLDRERLRLWLFARCVLESADYSGMADVARRLAPR